MKIMLWTTILVIATLTLGACQTSHQNPLITNDIIVDTPIMLISIDSDGDGVADELDQCPNTKMKENVIVDERGCHLIMGPDMSLKMEYRAFFAKGSSELSPRYYSQLDEVGIKMHEFDTATIKIEAHTSEDEVEKILPQFCNRTRYLKIGHLLSKII